MYADDIVFFSTSANGLQQKLKLLEKYCSDWCMKVNITKTKVFIFFYHIIKPILLYGSEIWGTFNVNNHRFRKDDPTNILVDDCYKNLPCETLHLKFCKFILGVNNKSVNHASLSELGRFPLHYVIIKTMIKYCHRLVNLSRECPLLKDAFSCCKDLHSTGKTSWYSSIDILL